MTKIAFIGAGSTIFAKNVLGDCLMVPAVNGFEFALYDIDPKRLKESKDMLEHLKNRYNDTVSIRMMKLCLRSFLLISYYQNYIIKVKSRPAACSTFIRAIR